MEEQCHHAKLNSQEAGKQSAATVTEKLRYLQQLLQSFDLSDLNEADRSAMQARLCLYQVSSQRMAQV